MHGVLKSSVHFISGSPRGSSKVLLLSRMTFPEYVRRMILNSVRVLILIPGSALALTDFFLGMCPRKKLELRY